MSVRWNSTALMDFPDDGRRREIIDGELYISKRQHFYHQVTIGTLVSAIGQWDRATHIGRAVSAPGLIFDSENDLVPDVTWVSHARLPNILSGGKLRAAPEIIAEILAAGYHNIARDREAKRKIYSRFGVREYWIVDWVARWIEIYRRTGEQLTLVATLHADDTLTSPLLPEFALSLAELFAPIPLGTTYTEDPK